MWHHGLTVDSHKKLESLQFVLRIIHQIVCDMSYDSACAFAGLQSLSARSYNPTAVYMTQWCDSEILPRLRRHSVYPEPNITN